MARSRAAEVNSIEGFEALKQRVTEKAKRRGIESRWPSRSPSGTPPIITQLNEL